MSYRFDKQDNSIVIDGFEKGIASSPYTGIANMRNVGISYMPSVAYVNYRRQASSLAGEYFFAGIHSVNVSNNVGWSFGAPSTPIMGNPVQQAKSPAGLNYILDTNGNVWKQASVNSSTFNVLGAVGRIGNGAGGLAFWNNYLVVFGDGMIEFCGNGTGDTGITGTNWNLPSNQNVVLTPAGYNSLSGTINGNAYATTFNAIPHTGDTSATLTNVWAGTSGTYNFQDGVQTISAVFTNASANVTFASLPSATYTAAFTVLALEIDHFPGAITFYQNDPVTFTVNSGALPAPLVAGTTYYLAAPITSTSSPVIVSTTPNGPFIGLTSTGTGGYTMTDSGSFLPIQNQASVNIAFTGVGSTMATLASLWTYPTGIYNIIDPIGDNVQASFTFDSTSVSLLNPLVFLPTGTYQVNILNPSPSTTSQAPYRAYNSKVDGNLYFANGRWVGRISYSNNNNVAFNPNLQQTYSVSYAATGTLQSQDVVNDMTDLRGQMIIAGNYDLYPWDYVSAQPSASSPVSELIYRITNLLNNIYIIAGQKGNIYVSNGYAAQILYKIPDYIAGVIDPVWSWGDLMIHRAKLYIQALAQNTAGSNLLAGIFSFNVSATLVTDVQTAGAFTMEAQNSIGLIPTSGSLPNGLLMDAEPSSNGQDAYYSAYSTGATTGNIDYNDTTLWQGGQAIIETDIIPIGTYLNKKTLGNIEFKLDRPLATGDSLALYWRPSLSDSYSSIPLIDTSTGLLSNYGITAINQSQWAQFEIIYTAAASGSSFLPLRELRLYVK